MDVDEVLQFARSSHHAVLATRRRDGGLQLSPVAVTADDDQTLVISSSETAMKTRNLRRDPRATVCILSDRFLGPWRVAEGTATVESLPGAMEDLVRYYRLVAGEHPDWADYRAAMVREQRVLLRIRVERVGPSVQG